MQVSNVADTDVVQSHFRAGWVGIIWDRVHRHGMDDLLFIIVISDACGNVPRKRILKIIDASWVHPYKTDLKGKFINIDWIKMHTSPVYARWKKHKIT